MRVEAFERAGTSEMHGYAWDDIDAVLDGTVTAPPVRVLFREDGRGMFYLHRLNMVFGPDGEGKDDALQRRIRRDDRERRPGAALRLRRQPISGTRR